MLLVRFVSTTVEEKRFVSSVKIKSLISTIKILQSLESSSANAAKFFPEELAAHVLSTRLSSPQRSNALVR